MNFKFRFVSVICWFYKLHCDICIGNLFKFVCVYCIFPYRNL